MKDAEPSVKKCRPFLNGCDETTCDEVRLASCNALVKCYDNGELCSDESIGVYQDLVPSFVTQCIKDVSPCE
jgi:hypothetical protein